MSYPSEQSLGLQESQYFDAVRLFSQRVQQVRPGWTMSEADLPHVLEICRLLEGLQGQLSSKELAQAKKRAQALKREEVVASLLSGLDATLTETPNGKSQPSE